MDENESVGPEQSTPVQAETEVFEGFKSAGLNEIQAFRTAEAVRAQAGHNIKETLEVHQGKVDTKVDGVETRLTAKVDGVDTKVDRVETKMDGVKTELKADIAVQGAELKAITRELSFFRWLLIIVVALLALLAAIGLLPKIEQWLGWDSTPTQSVQAPAEPNPTETAVPPEADSPEQSPE